MKALRFLAFFAVFLSLLICQPPALAQVIRLPRLSIDLSTITASGVSAGGHMAVQLQVAYSATFSGAGSVAGGVYWCAQGDAMKGYNVCMTNAGMIDVSNRVNKARTEARRHRIDSLTNLEEARIFIYNSPTDAINHPYNGVVLQNFFENFVKPENIHVETGLSAAHGFPTPGFGAPCAVGGFPWVVRCGVDMAGKILEHLYGTLVPPVEQNSGHLITFDQREFTVGLTRMEPRGEVYIPASCQDGQTRCRLHVALHGCAMNPPTVNDAFYAHAGFNRWAEANQTVVLYPAVASTPADPGACWDWWGYTGADYHVKSALQMTAIKAMVDRLTGNEY